MGEIEISNFKNIGILNIKKVLNLGTIILDSVGNGITNLDTLINYLGYFEITSRIGLSSQHGISNNSGYIMNASDITIQNGFKEGIHNDGTIVNNKNIVIDSSSNGIKNLDTIYNTASGLIEIKDSYGIEGGIWNSVFGVYLSNQGQLDIFSSKVGIENRGTFSNEGMILIDTARVGLKNLGELINQPLSSIKISNIDLDFLSIALQNFSNGSVQNSGLIEIMEAIRGLVHSSSGSFYNHASGVIEIMDCSDAPFDIRVGSIFDCQGILDVGN